MSHAGKRRRRGKQIHMRLRLRAHVDASETRRITDALLVRKLSKVCGSHAHLQHKHTRAHTQLTTSRGKAEREPQKQRKIDRTEHDAASHDSDATLMFGKETTETRDIAEKEHSPRLL